MNELGKLTGAGGCQIINAAGKYDVADGELIPGVTSLVIVTGAAAAISALSTQPLGMTAVALPTVNNIVGEDLSAFAGQVLTFKHPISTITVAANVVLIAYAG
jgi:hypothetical protein